jgi:AAA domain
VNPQPNKKIATPTPAQKAAFENLSASIGDIQTGAIDLPKRYGFFGPEHSGKTTLGAFAPRGVGIMARGEDGLLTLISAGRVPEVPHFSPAQKWERLLDYGNVLLTQDHNYRLVFFDTLNTVESLLHEYVCRTQFDNDFTKSGFLSYNAGYEVSLEPLRQFLNLLDRLRVERKMAIVFLGHTRVRTFKNPEGPDFDRYVPDLNEKTWGVVHRWLDMVGFLSFETVVGEVQKTGVGKKGKGRGGTRRVMYTERTAAYDAKNRLGLPESIDMGTRPEDSWANFAEALRQARAESRASKESSVEDVDTDEPADEIHIPAPVAEQKKETKQNEEKEEVSI